MPRLTVTFEPRAAERLESLATNGRTKSDVLREALALEQVYRDVERSGDSLVIRRKDGTETLIIRT